MGEYDGQVVLVTGAASGIGRGAALAFASAGAAVAGADIDTAGLASLGGEMAGLGARFLPLSVDVGQREEVEHMVAQTQAWAGRLDAALLNAGVAVSGPVHEVPLEDWDWIMRINLWSHIWAVRALAPLMFAQGWGHIVHTASILGLEARFETLLAPYITTKFGVVGLAESMRGYFGQRGVTVSVLCPGAIATNIHESARRVPSDTPPPQRERGYAPLSPAQLAEILLQGMREKRFYILAPEEPLLGLVTKKWGEHYA